MWGLRSKDNSHPSSIGGLRSRECGPYRRWWARFGLESGGGGGAVSVLEGPTSEVGLEPPHRAGHVVASSCKVVMGVGVGVGIVVAWSVVVMGTHLDLGLCSCFLALLIVIAPDSM